MLFEEGLEGAFRRHARLAEAVRRAIAHWAKAGGVAFNAVVPAERANSVTTVLVPEAFDSAALRVFCRETFDVSLGGGLGKLQGKAFRIGHMGDINEPFMLGALASVEATLQLMGIPYEKGGVTAAIDYLADTAGKAERAA